MSVSRKAVRHTYSAGHLLDALESTDRTLIDELEALANDLEERASAYEGEFRTTVPDDGPQLAASAA